MRLLLARGRAEGGRVDDANPLGEDAEAALGQQLAGVVLNLLAVLRTLDKDVGDGEGVVEGERGVVAARADLLGPDLAREVEHQAAAVALAIDVAGAVKHLLQGRDRQLDRPVARGRVLADRGVDRAGVLVFDARGRNQRAIGTLRRVALDFGARLVLRHMTSRVPRLLRAGARRVDGSQNYRDEGSFRQRGRRLGRYAGQTTTGSVAQPQDIGSYPPAGSTPTSRAVTGASERLRIVRLIDGSIEAKVPTGAACSAPSRRSVASPSRIT